jgi:hypothetical protein
VVVVATEIGTGIETEVDSHHRRRHYHPDLDLDLALALALVHVVVHVHVHAHVLVRALVLLIIASDQERNEHNPLRPIDALIVEKLGTGRETAKLVAKEEKGVSTVEHLDTSLVTVLSVGDCVASAN